MVEYILFPFFFVKDLCYYYYGEEFRNAAVQSKSLSHKRRKLLYLGENYSFLNYHHSFC